MEYGRRTMHALHQEHLRDQNKTQTVITAFFPSGNDGLLGRLFKFGDGRALFSELATDLIKSVLRRAL